MNAPGVYLIHLIVLEARWAGKTPPGGLSTWARS